MSTTLSTDDAEHRRLDPGRSSDPSDPGTALPEPPFQHPANETTPDEGTAVMTCVRQRWTQPSIPVGTARELSGTAGCTVFVLRRVRGGGFMTAITALYRSIAAGHLSRPSGSSAH